MPRAVVLITSVIGEWAAEWFALVRLVSPMEQVAVLLLRRVEPKSNFKLLQKCYHIFLQTIRSGFPTCN